MEDAVKLVAELMAISAKTAPKAVGKDYIDIKVAKEDEVRELGDAMLSLAEERGKAHFKRDGNNVLNSDAVLLLGLKDHPAVGLDCGGCGFDCDSFDEQYFEIDFEGPNCIYRLLDLGIALGSAVKTASLHNADSRIMYRVGVAAKRLGMVDSRVVLGIPISATGKSVYFDR